MARPCGYARRMSGDATSTSRLVAISTSPAPPMAHRTPTASPIAPIARCPTQPNPMAKIQPPITRPRMLSGTVACSKRQLHGVKPGGHRAHQRHQHDRDRQVGAERNAKQTQPIPQRHREQSRPLRRKSPSIDNATAPATAPMPAANCSVPSPDSVTWSSSRAIAGITA